MGTSIRDVHFLYNGNCKDLVSGIKREKSWVATPIKPLIEDVVDMEITAHSDNHPFYKPGIWWKAYFSIVFRRKNGKCESAILTLSDVYTCAAPFARNPETEKRECYERIPREHTSEANLRDDLLRLIKEEADKKTETKTKYKSSN